MANKFKFSEEAFEMKRPSKSSSNTKENSVRENVDVSRSVSNVDALTMVGVDVPSGLSGTRGKKGCKLPTINMRFSEANYEYLRREGAIRGLTRTEFVNWLIESYRSNPEHVHYDDSFKGTVDWK